MYYAETFQNRRKIAAKLSKIAAKLSKIVENRCRIIEEILFFQMWRCATTLRRRCVVVRRCSETTPVIFIYAIANLDLEIKEFSLTICKNILTCSSTLYGIEFLLYPLVSCWVAKKVKGNSLKLQFSIADFGRNMIPMDSIFFALYSAQKMEKTI